MNMTTRRLKRSLSAAAPALAALLALLLVALDLLAANEAAHRAMHGTQDGRACAVCLLAKGHLETAAAPPLPLTRSFWRVDTVRREAQSPLPAVDFALSPSRAPPGLPPLFKVVG